MILEHKKRFCDIGKTRVIRAPVFKHHIRNISPYKIYADNIEMFDAFADTVANFSPISMNIVDYWNKTFRTHDTYVWSPVDGVILTKIKDPAFGWRKSENHGFKNFSNNPNDVNPPAIAGQEEDNSFIHPYKDGDPIPGGRPIEKGDGRLLGSRRRSYIEGGNEREDGSCMDYNKRFFINPIIGVQDKLAMTYLNNFYSIYFKARQNPILRKRLLTIAKDPLNKLNDKEFFNNPNALFTEEKTVASKTFVTKKGTALGIKYAQKCAYDAQLQGPMSLFYMTLKSPRPFEYHMSSNVLEDLFEKFVKPLAHPIGFIYDYKATCRVLGAEDEDHPMVDYKITSDKIEINCLCRKEMKNSYKKTHNLIDDIIDSGASEFALGKDLWDKHPTSPKMHEFIDDIIDAIGTEETDESHEIRCNGEHQPKPRVIALSKNDIIEKEITDPKNPGKKIKVPYMDGLWSGIGEDAYGIEDAYGVTHFNILKDFKHSYGMFRNAMHEYKKYIFENENYLIAWYMQSKVQDEAPKVVIEYYRLDYNTVTGWSKIVTFTNDLHCNIADNLSSTRRSQITEEISVKCVPTLNGPFIMDVNPSDPNAFDKTPLPRISGHYGRIGGTQDGDNLGMTVATPGNPSVPIIKYRGFMTHHIGKNKLVGGKLIGWSVFRNPIK